MEGEGEGVLQSAGMMFTKKEICASQPQHGVDYQASISGGRQQGFALQIAFKRFLEFSHFFKWGT